MLLEYCQSTCETKSINQQSLSKTQKILGDISDKALSQKRKRTLIQSGGFASVLRYLLGPIISGITSLNRLTEEENVHENAFNTS